MKVNIKRGIISIVLITILFTLIDALFHNFIKTLEIYYYPIPSFLIFISPSPLFWYAAGKFAATIIIGIIIFYAISKTRLNKLNLPIKTLIFSAVIVAILEIRYIISGYYSTNFHIYNAVMHFCILFISSYAIFSIMKTFNKK